MLLKIESVTVKPGDAISRTKRALELPLGLTIDLFMQLGHYFVTMTQSKFYTKVKVGPTKGATNLVSCISRLVNRTHLR